MTVINSLASTLEQLGVLFALAGLSIIAFSVVTHGVRSIRGQGSLGSLIPNILVGIAIATFPQGFAFAVTFVIRGSLSSFVPGSNPAEDTSSPEPSVASPAPATTPDWSWVSGAMNVAAVVTGALVVGAGLFYFYSKFLRPSITKNRAEAQSAATLVSEARKALEWVVLDSASYETDLAKQIDYPMMTDVSEPLVGKYVREMRHVQELERALAKKPLLADAQHFSYAVTDLKVSYEAAVRKAERVRWSSFTFAEQKRLKDARIALDVVQDSSTTPEQRNAQYRRIAKLLDGLIVLTEPVRQSLSAWVPMLALETGDQAASVSGDKVLVGAR